MIDVKQDQRIHDPGQASPGQPLGPDGFARKKPETTARTRLQIGHQVANPHLEGMGNPEQRMEADPLLAALDLSDVNRVEIGLFRELLLAEAGPDALAADGITQQLKLSLAAHERSEKQGGGEANTPNMGLLFNGYSLAKIRFPCRICPLPESYETTNRNKSIGACSAAGVGGGPCGWRVASTDLE